MRDTYRGLTRVPTFNELVKKVNEPIIKKYPDRRATFMSNSPYLLALRGEGFMEALNMQQGAQIKEQQKQLLIRNYASQTNMSHIQAVATASGHSTPGLNLFAGGLISGFATPASHFEPDIVNDPEYDQPDYYTPRTSRMTARKGISDRTQFFQLDTPGQSSYEQLRIPGLGSQLAPGDLHEAEDIVAEEIASQEATEAERRQQYGSLVQTMFSSTPQTVAEQIAFTNVNKLPSSQPYTHITKEKSTDKEYLEQKGEIYINHQLYLYGVPSEDTKSMNLKQKVNKLASVISPPTKPIKPTKTTEASSTSSTAQPFGLNVVEPIPAKPRATTPQAPRKLARSRGRSEAPEDIEPRRLAGRSQSRPPISQSAASASAEASEVLTSFPLDLNITRSYWKNKNKDYLITQLRLTDPTFKMRADEIKKEDLLKIFYKTRNL